MSFGQGRFRKRFLEAFFVVNKTNSHLTFLPFYIIILNCNRAERSRDMLPKGVIARKVRASQGRVADNVSRRRLPGKCNRNKPPLVRGKDGKAR